MNNTTERFFSKVDKSAPNGCWLWTGGVNNTYGVFYHTNNNGEYYGNTAHRYSYEYHIGKIPDGMVVARCHHNLLCVNPEHLVPLTRKQAALQGTGIIAVNARKTHCPRGHAYDEANTHIMPDGSRWCRACNRERKREERTQRGCKRHYAYEYLH